jgi:flavin reductase (DIM6/NTAB) family NADH-FMN oxidoreductase RutF
MKKSLGAKTIVFPAPVFIIATYDASGKPNAMAAAWSGICCSDPPCIGVALREATYTYANILARKAFTVNIPSEKHIKEADYFGMASGRKEDKFAASGLTPLPGGAVDAPYVSEFPFVLECNLFKSLKIGLHTLFIGEIKDVLVDETALGEDGAPDIKKIKPMIFNPANRAYYGAGEYLGRAFFVGKKQES